MNKNIRNIIIILSLVNAFLVAKTEDVYRDKIKIYIDKSSLPEKFIIDKSKKSTSNYDLNKLLDIEDCKIIRKWIPRSTIFDQYQGVYLENYYVIEFNNIKNDIYTVASSFRLIPFVKSVELIPIVKIETIPNDFYWDAMYGLIQINALETYSLWDIDNGEIPGDIPNEEVVVGIVDLGLVWSHPDLIDNIWRNLGEDIDGDGDVLEFIDGEWVFDPGDMNSIDDDGDGYVDNFIGYDVAFDDNDSYPTNNSMSHGTNVAGCISGMTNNELGIASIGWSVKLMGVNSGQNSSNISHGYEGILAAAQMGADIINLSWGMVSYFESHEVLINTVFYEYDCILVGAAGNYGVNEPHYPASYENVISVTATGLNNQFNCWPNFHETVDISAPGENIWTTTTISGNGNIYSPATGTSFSSPIVAGAIALIKSVYPNADKDLLIEKTLSGTSYFDDMDGYCSGQDLSGLLGSGQLDVYEAIVHEIEPNLSISNISGSCFPGDTNEVVISFRNHAGSPPLENINVTLVTNNQRISIINESVEFDGVVSSADEFDVSFFIYSSDDMSLGDIHFSTMINAMPSGNFPSNLILDDYIIHNNMTIHFGAHYNGYPIEDVNIIHAPLVIDLYSLDNSYPQMILFSSDSIVHGKWLSGLNLVGFPYIGNSLITTDLASGDLDGDNDNEIIFGTDNGSLCVLNKDGTELVVYSQEHKIIGYPSLFDINNSGYLDIIFISENDSLSYLNVIDISGDMLPNFPISFNGLADNGVSIADIDFDGRGDLIFSISNNIYAINHDGQIKDGFPFQGDTTFSTPITLIDINSDDVIEILVGDNSGIIYILNGSGALDSMFNFEGAISSGISAGDIDQNGIFDIIFSSGSNLLHAWEPVSNEEVEGWPISIESPPLFESIIVDLNNDLCHDVLYSTILGNTSSIKCSGEFYDNFPYYSEDMNLIPPLVGDLDNDMDYELILGGNTSLDVLDISAEVGSEYSWSTYRGNFHRDGYYDVSQLSTQSNRSLDPRGFTLYNNFPNPFNPHTSIKFNLELDMEISINIYDIMGRNIKTIVKGFYKSGSHSIKWYGQNNDGSSVSSGIYFYELKSQDLNQKRKMVLIK